MADIQVFRNHIIEAEILDPEGVHHEFKSGMHGQKLDFDLIETGSQLYEEWVDVNANFIEQHYSPLPEVVLGVANGTNRLALDVARRFNGNIVGLVSEKEEDPDIIRLNSLARTIIHNVAPSLVVVVEDVGTTGGSSAQVAVAARDQGAEEVEALTSWQRRPELEVLDGHRIPHSALILEPLETYTPEMCALRGFCAQDWEFVPRPT